MFKVLISLFFCFKISTRIKKSPELVISQLFVFNKMRLRSHLYGKQRPRYNKKIHVYFWVCVIFSVSHVCQSVQLKARKITVRLIGHTKYYVFIQTSHCWITINSSVSIDLWISIYLSIMARKLSNQSGFRFDYFHA